MVKIRRGAVPLTFGTAPRGWFSFLLSALCLRIHWAAFFAGLEPEDSSDCVGCWEE